MHAIAMNAFVNITQNNSKGKMFDDKKTQNSIQKQPHS